MLSALRDGFRALFRSPGLAVLLWVANLGLSLLLAVPLALALEEDLRDKEAGSAMMYGFDYGWWSEWSDRQEGWEETFDLDIFGTGFAFKNVDLLLRGVLPAGLPGGDWLQGENGNRVSLPVLLLGLGVLYVLVQTFLTGGVLGVLRGGQGAWTMRGFLHGSGFYFGRLLRVALVALAVHVVLFRLYGPFARWVDTRALESVSESTAMAWTFGRNALLLLAVLFVSMLSGYAKVIVVLEERASALLAFVSAAGFAFRHFWRAYGHYLLMAAAAVVLLAVWAALDGAWTTTGYKTQIVTLVLMQALVLGRIGLRVATLGGQVALYRRWSGQ